MHLRTLAILLLVSIVFVTGAGYLALGESGHATGACPIALGNNECPETAMFTHHVEAIRTAAVAIFSSVVGVALLLFAVRFRLPFVRDLHRPPLIQARLQALVYTSYGIMSPLQVCRQWFARIAMPYADASAPWRASFIAI